MFIVRAFAFLALGLFPLSAQAQITFSRDDARLSLGMAWEQEIATVPSSLADAGFDIGASGADQSFDFTGSLANSPLTFVRSTVIPLEQAPDAARFPDADFAVHNLNTVPFVAGETRELETYHYFQRSAAGDVPVGAEGPDGQVHLSLDGLRGQAFLPLIEDVPWPLEFGKSWTVENSSVNYPIHVSGWTVSESYHYQFTIDAWGEIRLPMGTFECLRVRQTGTRVITFTNTDDDQPASLNETTNEIDAYAWYARGIGGVAAVVETKQTYSRNVFPPDTFTLIARLTTISSPVTATASESWGALKQKFAE